MGQQIVERAESLKQGGGGLLADTGHTLDVVDRVTRQRHQVDHRLGLHTQFVAHLAHARALVAHRVPQRYVRADQLHEVLVGGDDNGVQTLACGARRQRADQIISFVTVQYQTLNAERLDQAMDVWNLHHQVVGRHDAIGFIGLEQVVAEGFFGRIEHDRQAGGMRVLEQLEQHPRKAIDCVGGQAARVVELWQGVKGPKNVARAVHQVERCSPVGHDCEANRTKLDEASGAGCGGHGYIDSPARRD